MWEDVRGLTNWNGGLVFDEVQAELEAEGYEVLPFLLPACAVNAPHRRDRIWFVAHCNEETRDEKTRQQREQYKQKRDTIRKINLSNCCAFNATNADGKRLQERIQSGFGCISGKEGTPARGESSRRDTANDWAEFPTQSPVCSRNDGLSSRLDGITFPKWREKSIGGFGNAIVPHLAYQIFKAIQQYKDLQP